MKLTVSKSKNSASFYVQKTIRKKSGPTTITVEKLGNLDEVRTKAGGKDPMYGLRSTSMNSTAGNTRNRGRSL